MEAEIRRLCREVLQTLAPIIIAAGSQSGVEVRTARPPTPLALHPIPDL
jgi:hypothetical protein